MALKLIDRRGARTARRCAASATRCGSSPPSSTPASRASSTAAARRTGPGSSPSSTSRARTCSTHARAAELSIDERVRLFLAVLEAVAVRARRGWWCTATSSPATSWSAPTGGRGCSTSGSPSCSTPPGGRRRGWRRAPSCARFTPAYASPEQFRGERVTAAVRRLLAGRRALRAARRAFAPTHRRELARTSSSGRCSSETPSRRARRARRLGAASRHGQREAAAGASAGGWCGRDLDAICLKALRKEPGERYATAAAFADDLRRHLAGRPVLARRGGGSLPPGEARRRHRGRLRTAAASALARRGLLALARTCRAHGSERPRPPPSDGRHRPASEVVSVEDLQRRLTAVAGEHRHRRGAGRGPHSRGTAAGGDGDRRPLAPDPRRAPIRWSTTRSSAAIALDEPQSALAVLNRGLDNARAADRGDLLPRLHGSRGRVLSDLGRREEARAEYELARDYAQRTATGTSWRGSSTTWPSRTCRAATWPRGNGCSRRPSPPTAGSGTRAAAPPS